MIARARITCVDCGSEKDHRDGFPDRTWATCWECAWDEHIHKSHGWRVWRVRRRAKRRARRIGAHDLAKAMFEHERRQVLGLDRLREADHAD